MNVHRYRCSSFHQEWVQSQRCRCTGSFRQCWHNVRYDTSLRSRCTHQYLGREGGRGVFRLSLTVSQVRYQSVSVLDTVRPTYPVYPYHPTVGIKNDHGEWLEHTNAGLFGGGALVAFVTLAVVWSRCVDTVSVDTRVADTLIHIWRREERRRERRRDEFISETQGAPITNLNTPIRVKKRLESMLMCKDTLSFTSAREVPCVARRW